MNKERILAVADAITSEEGRKHFNMEHWLRHNNRSYGALPSNTALTSCGTTACIAGWVVHLFGKPGDDLTTEAESLLDLSRAQAANLFIPTINKAYEDITPDEAAIVLRHLAATGEVDWGIAGLEEDD